jgi:PhoPQ-activated pathogenicity-related protein
MRATVLLTLVACFATASAVLLPVGSLPLRKYARTGITRTALDDYVDKPDSNYAFNVVKEEEGLGFTAVFVNMTSQQWLTPELVSRSIWFHGLVIMIPHKIVDDEHAFLYITGGGNDNPDNIFCKLTDEDCALGGALALSAGTVSAVLFQIPNAHIVFTEDPSQKRRSEDAIIAWTWFHFINNPQDSEWLLRLPMTKASVRAMDTVQAVVKQRLGKDIEKFCVAGASKRGWTTWTTTIVDTRVIGSIPMVMDLLNFVNSTHHHFRALGGWTFAFSDYYQLNFTGELDNPGTQLMADIIDPYNYKDRLTMPMMLMTSSGDEFFMPDDSHWYFKELIQPKFMRVVGNAEHSLAEHLLQEVFCSSTTFGRTHLPRTFALTFLTLSNYIYL